mmetsp:Transcript_74481/g.125467  ORF Transcript_74481/g.125467 Transcript_74481/m.125467 type:complete len:288 (+) Transcript_74481:2677-3540(+)
MRHSLRSAQVLDNHLPTLHSEVQRVVREVCGHARHHLFLALCGIHLHELLGPNIHHPRNSFVTAAVHLVRVLGVEQQRRHRAHVRRKHSHRAVGRGVRLVETDVATLVTHRHKRRVGGGMAGNAEDALRHHLCHVLLFAAHPGVGELGESGSGTTPQPLQQLREGLGPGARSADAVDLAFAVCWSALLPLGLFFLRLLFVRLGHKRYVAQRPFSLPHVLLTSESWGRQHHQFGLLPQARWHLPGRHFPGDTGRLGPLLHGLRTAAALRGTGYPPNGAGGLEFDFVDG